MKDSQHGNWIEPYDVCIWLNICVIEVPYSLHRSAVALFCDVFCLTIDYYIYAVAKSLIN